DRLLGGRVVNDLRLDHPVMATQVCDPPLAVGLHVLIPGGVVAERPRDDEAVAQWPHPDRRGVLAARAPAAVAQDADDRHPATSCNKQEDRKSTRLNSSHQIISYAVFCLKKKK